jgi:hypothetical protein
VVELLTSITHLVDSVFIVDVLVSHLVRGRLLQHIEALLSCEKTDVNELIAEMLELLRGCHVRLFVFDVIGLFEIRLLSFVAILVTL